MGGGAHHHDVGFRADDRSFARDTRSNGDRVPLVGTSHVQELVEMGDESLSFPPANWTEIISRPRQRKPKGRIFTSREFRPLSRLFIFL